MAKTVEHKRYRELSNRVGADFSMRVTLRFPYKKNCRHNQTKSSGRSTGVKLDAIHLVLRGQCVTRGKPVQKHSMLMALARAATAAATAAVEVRTK